MTAAELLVWLSAITQRFGGDMPCRLLLPSNITVALRDARYYADTDEIVLSSTVLPREGQTEAGAPNYLMELPF